MQRQREKRPYMRKIDFVFYNERAIRAAVLDARNDTREVSPRNGSGLPDPTAYEAITNLTPIPAVEISGQLLEHPERWLTVVDKTYAWCQRQSDVHYEIARRRYNGEDYRKTCRELAISTNVLFPLMERVRMYAALQAAQFQLIFVD